MDVKKAIKELDDFQIDIDYDCDFKSEFSYAIDVAKDALEKQVPKKPKKDEYGFYHCPHCGADYDSLMHDSNLSCTYNYCTECGQKLDWSK